MVNSEPADPRAPDDGQVVAEMVAAAHGGDNAAWNSLVQRFSGSVWAIARAYRLNSADAAEVTQSVWLKLVENLGKIRDPGSVGAWLATVTRHECLRRIRQSSRMVTVAEIIETDAQAIADDLDAGMLADERSAALWRAFDRLSPQCRALMRLLMVEPRLSYAEISAALDMPIGSIGPIRQRCITRLRTSPEVAAIAGMAS